MTALLETAYPRIDSMPAVADRPFWSVMIPVYNCAAFLRLTLRSVLEQLPAGQNIQIEVIDDCSTRDDPAAVVAACGDPRVTYYRQPANVGPQANFTDCARRSRGEWVHILHGDDMVGPGFYRTLEAIARARPSIGAMFCRTINVDADNSWLDLSPLQLPTGAIHTNLLERLAVENLIMFPSIVVKRATYERVGGFHPSLFHSADWDMWKRVALATPVWYEPQPLAIYRIHGQSDTSSLMRTGANIADARHAIAVSRRYLPERYADEWSRQALEHHALYAIELAQEMIDRRSWRSAWAQLTQALRCSCSRRVLAAAAGLAFRLSGAAGRRSAAHLVRVDTGESPQDGQLCR